MVCKYCDLLVQREVPVPYRWSRCPRCGGGLLYAKTKTVNRTLAFALAGLFLYIPANFFPIFILKNLGNVRYNTMFTGVLEFARQGFWDVAFLVFLTSMVVPLFKLAALFYVLLAIQFNRPLAGAPFMLRWYHHLEEWGMLGVFMLAMLVALTKLDTFATVYIGFGFYCFIGLLIINLLATAFLDEQKLWEHLENLQ